MVNSCTRVFFFFFFLQRIYSLFTFLTKSLSQTRWECRIESVKTIKFQAPKIRDTLVQLSKTSEDPKIKSEVIHLATYEMENFEFLLGMNIWYDILFAVNFVSKIMQSKDMNIDVAIDHLRGLITYVKNYREMILHLLESIKEMTIEMDIEPKFNEKRKIHRKKHFDDIVSDEIAYSIEDSFHVDYFLYVLDQFISSIESRFKQFLEHENMFGFLFDSNKFKTLSEDELKKYCINLEKILSFKDHSDIDGLDLFSK
ncbi:hypothetical protein JHK84_040878 [Glycine max]|nr:hypothetical protein JHK84_040878 [Glycine max]